MTYFVLQRENTMQTSTDTTPAKNLMSSLSEIDDIDLKNSCVAIGFVKLPPILGQQLKTIFLCRVGIYASLFLFVNKM